jgi:hypothetical protein
MKRRTAICIAAPLLALAAAGCSSSSSSSAAAKATPSTMTGTQTLTAIATGSAAAANFNSSSSAPLKFPEAVWAGPVNTTVKPFALPGSGGSGGNGAATITLVTPVGNAKVHHSANQAPGANNPNQPPPATWSKSGTTCYFTTTFSKGTGTFLGGTGKFAGATGTFTYLVTAQGYAPLKSGQTKCGFTTIGNVENNGAKISFLVSGPLTVKS